MVAEGLVILLCPWTKCSSRPLVGVARYSDIMRSNSPRHIGGGGTAQITTLHARVRWHSSDTFQLPSMFQRRVSCRGATTAGGACLVEASARLWRSLCLVSPYTTVCVSVPPENPPPLSGISLPAQDTYLQLGQDGLQADPRQRCEGEPGLRYRRQAKDRFRWPRARRGAGCFVSFKRRLPQPFRRPSWTSSHWSSLILIGPYYG